MEREDTRKIRRKDDTFVVDDQGRNLDLTKIKYSAVNSYEEAVEAYKQHDYARDGPSIISCQTSRETDQDSAWDLEMNHQEHCTKNDIKNHTESNHWRKGCRSQRFTHSVATICIYKDFIRAIQDPKQSFRFNRSGVPDSTKRFQRHYGKKQEHWQDEATGARDRRLEKKRERNAARSAKNKKRKASEMNNEDE